MITVKESDMSKDKGSREAKKPKQNKPKKGAKEVVSEFSTKSSDKK
jgi:hypothetical protein